MATDQVFIGEGFEPDEPVGIGPDRVVDPGEIRIETTASLFEEMG